MVVVHSYVNTADQVYLDTSMNRGKDLFEWGWTKMRPLIRTSLRNPMAFWH